MKKINLKKLNTYLLITVIVILLANTLVGVYFAVSTQMKLAEAIDLAKPEKVTLTVIESEDCDGCKNLDEFKAYIAKQNVEISDDRSLLASSDEGKDLINKYEIQTLPALVLESENAINARLKTALEKSSRAIGDEVIIWEQQYPPYLDVETNQVSGLVNVTYITDTSCTECVDVEANFDELFKAYGVRVVQKNVVDVSEQSGRELIEEYEIQKVPAMIVSSQIQDYKGLFSRFEGFGTIEDDLYIFREIEVLSKPYRDLTSRLIIQPVNETQ